MLIRSIRSEEKELYNLTANHPLQSWEWGEFRKRTGVEVERLGFFEGEKLIKGLQVTFHALPLPGFNYKVGYLPKGFAPDEDQLSALKQLAEKHQALFIKLEPNLLQAASLNPKFTQLNQLLLDQGAVKGRPLFTKFTFQLDLNPTEDELMANFHKKTRYNIRLAQKKGVEIVENTTAEGMEEYIKILEETKSRQGFYAHTPEYFRQIWEELKDSGMIKIFQAEYQGKILASWIMFVFNDILYYPYGASRSIHREVMASNLLMWEMIRFGKNTGCHAFDMWGSLGPEPDPNDPWFGFHRFKKGYGGELMQSPGSFDLVMNQPLYKLYRVAEKWRWRYLRLKAKLPF